MCDHNKIQNIDFSMNNWWAGLGSSRECIYFFGNHGNIQSIL